MSDNTLNPKFIDPMMGRYRYNDSYFHDLRDGSRPYHRKNYIAANLAYAMATGCTGLTGATLQYCLSRQPKPATTTTNPRLGEILSGSQQEAPNTPARFTSSGGDDGDGGGGDGGNGNGGGSGEMENCDEDAHECQCVGESSPHTMGDNSTCDDCEEGCKSFSASTTGGMESCDEEAKECQCIGEAEPHAMGENSTCEDCEIGCAGTTPGTTTPAAGGQTVGAGLDAMISSAYESFCGSLKMPLICDSPEFFKGFMIIMMLIIGMLIFKKLIN